MNIIAIDPGGTTGIAEFIVNEQTRDTLIRTSIKPCASVMLWLNKFNPAILDTVVIEYFATAGRLSRYGLETIDLVGQVKGWCLAKGILCVPQSPMSRRAWINDAEHWHNEKRIIHEVDALAHLFQFLEMKLHIKSSDLDV